MERILAAGWYWFPESTLRHHLDETTDFEHVHRCACGVFHTLPGELHVHRDATVRSDDDANNCWLCRYEIQARADGRLKEFAELGQRVEISVSPKSKIYSLNGKTGRVRRVMEETGQAVIAMDEPYTWPVALGGGEKLCHTIRLYARQCLVVKEEEAPRD